MKDKRDISNDSEALKGGGENGDKKGEGANGTRSRFYAAIAAAALSAVALGLAFLPAVGLYFLVSSVLLEICALSFSAAQKKINPFPAVKILEITVYVLLFLSLALFTGGLICSSSTK